MNETPFSEELATASPAEENHSVPQTDEASAVPCTPSENSAPESCGEALAAVDPETDLSDPTILADPCTDPDPDPLASAAALEASGLDELRSELIRLREEIAAREAFRARLEAEYGDFAELYPGIALSSLSDSVWQAVQGGTPLAAAYALEERRRYLTAQKAKASNEKNSERSSGGLQNAPNDHYSIHEVRAMSRSEVRERMPQIMESMKKWH